MDNLNPTLLNLGYESKAMSHGSIVSVKSGTMGLFVQLVLSPDNSMLGININLGSVKSPEDVTALQWRTLLEINEKIEPAAFFYDPGLKHLILHRALDNRGLTPAILKFEVDRLVKDATLTADAWSFCG